MNKFELLVKYGSTNYLHLVEEHYMNSDMSGFIEIKRELDALIRFIDDGELPVDSDKAKQLRWLREDVNRLLMYSLIDYYEMTEKKFKDGEISVRI